MLAKEIRERFQEGNELILTDVAELDITNEEMVMNFVKNEKLYHIPREKQISQAEKAGINFKALYNSECKKKKSKIEQYYESEDYDLDNPFNSILLQLSKSPLHSDISLSRKDRVYYLSHSIEEIQKETEEVIKESLYHIIPKDKDKHTREWGKPVYVAQRATGCCCRNCLYEWHNIPTNRRLSENEMIYIRDLLMEWMKRDMKYS